MKKLLITSMIFGLSSAVSLPAVAYESLLDDLDRFSALEAEARNSDRIGGQPDIGSTSYSESILEDLDVFRTVGSFKSRSYSAGYTGSETLHDDLEIFK